MSDETAGSVIGVLLFEGVEELDFVGPWEVFGAARDCGADLQTLSVAEQSGLLRCAHGLRVSADCGFDEAPPLDILVIPGGYGTRKACISAPTLRWICKASEDARWVASVCTGARLLAQTGLTARRKMTTHWQFLSELAARKDVEVVTNQRYVRDGKFISAAGVSAGIDMSLWLVGQIFGDLIAQETQAYMEYDPEPPYDIRQRLGRAAPSDPQ